MTMNARTVVMFTVVGLLALSASAASAAEGSAKHGKADSRAPYPHRIMLLNEQGNGINPGAKDPLPYSPAATCGKCHNYPAINQGWHFNAKQPNVSPGRPGEPWVYLDGITRTQLPLSYRAWEGTYRPGDVGLTDWQFVQAFARHMPGGGVGENPTTRPVTAKAGGPPEYWQLSGKLQTDCMICHDGGGMYSTSDRELELKTMNYRFAPTRALGLGKIKDSVRSIIEEADASGDDPNKSKQTPKVNWDMRNIDTEMRAVLNVSRDSSAERCNYCHTTRTLAPGSQGDWQADKDVHLAAGLTCSDCHRHGEDHQVVRGYESEYVTRKEAAALSCRGCHLGQEGAEGAVALGGRLGAPRPVHYGIPPVHFQQLSCTACHSGPWPTETPSGVQTSLAHELGLESFDRTPESAPRVVAPVFLRSVDNKITPHKMVWPNFWGSLQNDKVTPMLPGVVKAVAKDSLKEIQGKPWAALTDEQVGKVLGAMTGAKEVVGEPVYVSGGKLYRRLADGKVAAAEHSAAKPYAWPLAHDVRPAAQSLGVRGCSDCHASNGPIHFAKVVAQGPVAPAQALTKAMYELRGDNGLLAWLFAFTFNFRLMLKIISFGSAAVLAGILILYGLRGLHWLTSRMS